MSNVFSMSIEMSCKDFNSIFVLPLDFSDIQFERFFENNMMTSIQT